MSKFLFRKYLVQERSVESKRMYYVQNILRLEPKVFITFFFASPTDQAVSLSPSSSCLRKLATALAYWDRYRRSNSHERKEGGSARLLIFHACMHGR